MRKLCCPAALTVACLAGLSAYANTGEGRQLAAACASCHGKQSSQAAIPTLAGRSEVSIVQALSAYRSGERVSQIMQMVSAALSPGEIVAVAHAIATQPPGVGR